MASGSVFSSIFGPQVNTALAHLGMAAGPLATAQRSMQAATFAVARLPVSLRPATSASVTRAFMDGLHRGRLVAALVAVLVAVLALRFLPERRAAPVQSGLREQFGALLA